MRPNDTMKNVLIWVAIIAVVFFLFSNLTASKTESNKTMDYSAFVQGVQAGDIKKVTIDDRTITGSTMEGTKFVTYMPWVDPFLTDQLISHSVDVVATPPEERSLFMSILISWLPLLIIFGLWFFFMRQMSGGGKGGAFSFGRSRARLLGEDQVKVTLADVAGIDDAKEEVGEIVDFLKDPKRYQDLGGKIPRGVLMVGSPGTGKTLLARAIAGEAKVPFFSISGSDFVEMFVGVGASRVRDMFEQAKKRAPCIIFIDEIDAVGRHRGAGMGGGHDEREQTLNQLLVEMDGFAENQGVIVIAATNRPDVLDPALLRPGRFDRQVVVGLPDIKGREQILKVHMKKVQTDDTVQVVPLARGTPGFSGAELANLVNEAALCAARAKKKTVSMSDFEQAKDKILMGTERRTLAMTPEEKKLTAYHESGHTIVGKLVPEHDPVYKVSIIPRGRALGVTMYLPEQDRVSYSKERLESQLSSLYGGRLAEELIFGASKVTTGASNDIQRATDIARKMVTKWGLSDKLGPLMYGEEHDQPFLGQSMGMGARQAEFSDATAKVIDEEVRKFIDRNYSRAKKLLEENVDILHTMADALMKYETIDAGQVDDLMARRTVRESSDLVQTKPKADDADQGAKKKAPKKTKTATTPSAEATA